MPKYPPQRPLLADITQDDLWDIAGLQPVVEDHCRRGLGNIPVNLRTIRNMFALLEHFLGAFTDGPPWTRRRRSARQ